VPGLDGGRELSQGREGFNLLGGAEELDPDHLSLLVVVHDPADALIAEAVVDGSVTELNIEEVVLRVVLEFH
jgi:hypothetical protein